MTRDVTLSFWCSPYLWNWHCDEVFLPFFHIYVNAEVMMLAVHIDACQALILSSIFEIWWECGAKTSQVTYVTMVPRVGNETLRPLGVAMGNAVSVTRVCKAYIYKNSTCWPATLFESEVFQSILNSFYVTLKIDYWLDKAWPESVK